jgi:hypothetical protein
LVEGLAVWASDGHYRLAPIDAWAAVTAASDNYIPLTDLRAGPFYSFQHEISYLEAASFVKFLIERYGLDKLKELYRLTTGEVANDEAVVDRLYGQGYAQLEAEWLEYLGSLSPTPQQTRTWQLQIRSFDLMRRYETELDPGARLLPAEPPPEWMSDTLQVFLHRTKAQMNIALETALIASQDRLHSGDPDGAAALLDDVEEALDAGGELTPPSLQARQAILELLAAQDRAVLRADSAGYLATLDPAYTARLPVEEMLQLPFTRYEQEVVRLDVADKGFGADGMVLVHAQVADGGFADDGRLFAVTFVKTGTGWLVSNRKPVDSILSLPAVRGD